MTTWKKAFSTLATASLLASLFATSVAAPVSAATTSNYLNAASGSAVADGTSTVIIGSKSAAIPVGTTLKIEVTGGASISAVVGTGVTKTSSTTAEFYADGSATWGDNNKLFAFTATKAGTYVVTVSTKPFQGTYTVEGERTVTFKATNATDLKTPIMAITQGACTAAPASVTDPEDKTTATGTGATAYFGSPVACAWVLLAQNDSTSGSSNLSINDLSTWTFSIAPYGLLHSAANGQDASVTSLTDVANNIITVTLTEGDAAGVYTAAGVTIYANNTAGKTTVSWTGKYRGKLYSASDKLTLTGPQTGIKITSDAASVGLGDHEIDWTATDVNGLPVSGSSGDLTSASTAATVAKVTAIGSGTATIDCITTGTAVITLKAKSGAYTSNGYAITCGAGAAAKVTVTAASVAVGGVATVVVTVKDKNGLLVQEGTPVTVWANGGTWVNLTALSFGGDNAGGGTVNGAIKKTLWAPSVPSTIALLAAAGVSGSEVTGTGTLTVTASAATTTSNANKAGTGAYSTKTKVVKRGTTVTWRASFSDDAAGDKLYVYVATNSGSGWSAAKKTATVTVDASGNAYFKRTYKSAKWIRIYFVHSTDGDKSNTVAARWL